MTSSGRYRSSSGADAPAVGNDHASLSRLPSGTASIADIYADLLEPLATQQRLAVIQHLADDFYQDLIPVAGTGRLPAPAEVANLIAELRFPMLPGHHHPLRRSQYIQKDAR